jgi:hypothetical protein
LPKLQDVVTDLSHYAATLILEDPYSQRNYTSPPNRFYEALSAGTAMFFTQESVLQFAHAGYHVQPFVVKSPEELLARLPEASSIAEEQSRWHRDYLGELKTQFTGIVEKLDQGALGRLGPKPGCVRHLAEIYEKLWKS